MLDVHPSPYLSIYHSQLPTLYAPQSSTSHGIKCPSYQIIGGPMCLSPVSFSFHFSYLFLLYHSHHNHHCISSLFFSLQSHSSIFFISISVSTPNQTSYKYSFDQCHRPRSYQSILSLFIWTIIPHIYYNVIPHIPYTSRSSTKPFPIIVSFTI